MSVGHADAQVISLRLNRPEEMFQLDPADLFSEYRNFLTGIEYSISMLRSSRSRRPVSLQLTLPASEIDEGIEVRIGRTLQRYCDYRIGYNTRERRATRLDGLYALWIGVPIVVVGFLTVILIARAVRGSANTNLVVDTGGWVLVWVGLWYPLDSMVFSPLGYGRENRALRKLRDAPVHVVAAAAHAGA